MATGPRPDQQAQLSRPEQGKLDQALKLAAGYRAAFGRRGGAGAGTARDQEVVLVLARDAPASASAIARVLGRDRASVTRALERLRQRRLVRVDAVRGRAQPHRLTASGWRIVHAILAAL
jgi:DNA-binding MarR family transcriptional regulator